MLSLRDELDIEDCALDEQGHSYETFTSFAVLNALSLVETESENYSRPKSVKSA